MILSKYDPASEPENSPETVKSIVAAMEEGKTYNPVKDENILRKILGGRWSLANDDPMRRIEVRFLTSGKLEVYDDYSLDGEKHETYKGKWTLKDGILIIDANEKYSFKIRNFKMSKEKSSINLRKKMMSPLIEFEPYPFGNGMHILGLYLEIYKW